MNYKLLAIVGISGFLIGFTLVVRAYGPTPQQSSLFALRANSDWKRDAYRKKYNESVENYLARRKSELAIRGRLATVTAYSCVGLVTEAEIKMNCPSLLSGGPTTADGSKPVPYKTVACDRANIGRIFWIDVNGGIEVVCADRGSAINGSGRFDLYVSTVREAREWGVQKVAYMEL